MDIKFFHIYVYGAVFILAPFTLDIYLPAFPEMAESFQTGIDEIEFTVSIFLLGFATGQLILGTVSDVVGHRKVIIIGIVVFIIATVLTGTAGNLQLIYISRFFQAFGSACSVAVFPLVHNQFNDTESTKIISYIMAMIEVAPIVAPVIGSYILVFAGWRELSPLIAILGLIVLFTSKLFINETQFNKSIKIKRIIKTYCMIVSEKGIMLSILAGGFAFAGLFAFVTGSPFVYIEYFGLSPEYYGYLFSLNALAVIGINFVNARFLADFNPVAKIFKGSVLLTVTGLAILTITILNLGIIPLALSVVIFFVAIGLTETNAVISALSVLPEYNGAVSAFNSAIQCIIGAFSSFLIGITASNNAIPMSLLMAGSGLAVFISALLLKRYSINNSQQKNPAMTCN